MALQADEQAPGVSATLRRRIATALDAGERPSLQGTNLKLGTVVLQSANGTDRPALAETQIQMRRRNLDTRGAFDVFNSAPVRRGRGRYAADINGVERMITRTVNGEQRVTAAGRRYYNQSYTRWLVHIPTILVRKRTGTTFQRTRHDRTGEDLGLSTEIQARGSEAEQRRQVQAAVEAYLERAGGENAELDIYEGDEDVAVRYDSSRAIEYSMQTQGLRDGQMTADTILDRVVFGEPIMAEDMWQLGHLHEVSRRRSGECGLDVIVASATQRQGYNNTRKPIMTAEKAAQALLTIARETDPEGELAKATFKEVPQTAEVAEIDADLRLRAPDVSSLLPFKDGMLAFLEKPRSLADVEKAINKNHIWRGSLAVPVTFAKAVKAVFPWSQTPRKRLLMFLRSMGFFVQGEQVTIEEPILPDAIFEAVRQCGIPVWLLQRYYMRLGVKLVLFNGSRCISIWEPGDWASRAKNDKIAVILNVWSDHVSCYKSSAGDLAPRLREEGESEWRDVRIRVTRSEADEHKFDGMKRLEWDLLLKAYQEKEAAVFWTTDEKSLRDGLRKHDYEFRPNYAEIGHLSFVDIPFSDDHRHRKSIRIRLVPDNHAELRQFCQNVQDKLRLRLWYKGESTASLGHNFLREYLVQKRTACSKEHKLMLLSKQNWRCAKCMDRIAGTTECEAHHDPPVVEGGKLEDVVLICPTCHAEETEKQELVALGSPQYFESQLSYDMMNAFMNIKKPTQLHYGDPTARQRALASDDFQSLECLDICGCRSNALLSREWLPVGSPIDHFSPVFDSEKVGSYYRPLEEYAWIWVEAEGTHDLFFGSNLYPLETVQILIEDGFIIASAETLPLGWKPKRWFPSSDLKNAWDRAKECGADKMMILATIGLWNRQKQYSYFARTTNCEEDMPGPVCVKHFKEDGSTVMMCRSEVFHNRTMLPVSLLCLFDEQRRMYRARQLVARVPAIVPLGCRVDGLFFVGPEAAKEQLRRLCSEEKYPCLQTDVFQFKQAKWKEVPEREQFKRYEKCTRPSLRYKWEELEEDELESYLLSEHFTKESLDSEAQSVIDDMDGKLDMHQAHAVLAAANNMGAKIIGPAGTGKSQVIKATRAYLESLGFKVIVAAYTHAACRLVGGQTISHLLHLNAYIDNAWILIDEVALLPISTLGEIARWQALNAKFIVFGDYEGQFEAFRDRWRFNVSAEWSPLMHELCGGLHISLSTYRRGTDLELFKWYCGMYGNESPPVSKTRFKYPAACDPRDNPLVLCVSHKKRMQINAKQNLLLKPESATFCECSEEQTRGCTMLPQDMFIWVGIELIGCPRGSGKSLVVQGVLYTVVDIRDKVVQLRMREEYCRGEKDEEVEVPLNEVCSQLRLTHAMCYYTCQGRTVKDRHILLMDTTHSHFSTRSLIVGLSRTTHGRFLHIGDEESEEKYCGRRVRQESARVHNAI